jgi:hypothetical protein
MPLGGKRPGAGRKPLPQVSSEEFEAMVKEQMGMCALCSEPGSVGLVVDRDGLSKKTRGLLHPKCKAFLSLGRDNPLRFQMAIRYLVQRTSVHRQ